MIVGITLRRQVDGYEDGLAMDAMNASGSWGVYIAALHYSIMTITSIGYGDISPQQSEESAGRRQRSQTLESCQLCKIN